MKIFIFIFILQTCERERRHREHEARLARQRQFEEERNRRALERALAPPFIKVKQTWAFSVFSFYFILWIWIGCTFVETPVARVVEVFGKFWQGSHLSFKNSTLEFNFILINKVLKIISRVYTRFTRISLQRNWTYFFVCPIRLPVFLPFHTFHLVSGAEFEPCGYKSSPLIPYNTFGKKKHIFLTKW